MSPSPDLDRAHALRQLAGGETFDVVVIGGGIVGTGCALDAAARGLRVALVERHDLSSGTSSKSSKLIHGGLRYLQQGHLHLVYEALAERHRLTRNAPHLVELTPFLLPIFRTGGFIDRRLARGLGAAMWGYDLTGGFRCGKLHDRLDHAETLRRFPTLDPARVAYSYVYYDARADDARLVVSVARTAAQHGAVVANYTTVTGLRSDDGGAVTGVRIDAGGDQFDVTARVVVNATGVWSDQVSRLQHGVKEPRVRPAKGIHLTFPAERIGATQAAVIPVPGERRTLFVIPWGEHTYVGTTDTDYAGDIDAPTCDTADVQYLLRALNAALTTPVTEADIVGRWAGLRPLLRASAHATTTDLSRRHEVTVSASGLVTVNGGKLTTYRRMAADAIDVVMHRLGRRGASLTRDLPLYGAAGEVDRELAACGDRSTRLVANAPYTAAHAVHAVRHEGAQTLDDVLSRRTRLRMLEANQSASIAPRVAALIAPELGWSPTRQQIEVDSYVAGVRAETAG